MERIHPERLRRSAIPCRRIHYPPDSLRYGPRDLVALPRAVELANETVNGRPGVIRARVARCFGQHGASLVEFSEVRISEVTRSQGTSTTIIHASTNFCGDGLTSYRARNSSFRPRNHQSL